METILIWLGSGFAFAVGVFAGSFLMAFVYRSKSANDEVQDRMNDLLEQRNEIGERQAAELARIVDAIKNK